MSLIVPKSFTETDPVFSAAPASGITAGNITNWNTAYGWGDHAAAGYVTPSSVSTFTNKSGNISQWTNDVGYLTTETFTGTVTSVGATVPTGLSVSGSPITSSGTLDITFTAGYSIPTTASQANWNTAYSWGDHAAAGYLDDYEEGTWTATFVPSNNGFTPTNNTSTGRYVKVGKLVTAIAVAKMTVPASLGTYVNNSAANALTVTGLPFLIANNSNLRSAPSLGISTGIATVAGTLVGEGGENLTLFSIVESKDNGSVRTGPTLTVSTTVALRLQFTYITN